MPRRPVPTTSPGRPPVPAGGQPSSVPAGAGPGAAAWVPARWPPPSRRRSRPPGGAAGASRRTVAISSSERCSGGVGGRHQRAHRRERGGLEHGRPPVGAVGGLQRRGRRLGEPVASWAGNGTPALGGTDDRRNARTTRPTSSAASTSPSQSVSSSSCFVASACFSSAASCRVDSSRATTGSSADATTLRRSREVEVIELALGRLGPVEPVGDAQPGDQLLGHLEHRRLRHQRACPPPSAGRCPHATAGGRRRCPARASSAIGRCSSGSDASTSAASLLAGAEPLGLGPLRELGRRREPRTLATPLGSPRGPGAVCADDRRHRARRWSPRARRPRSRAVAPSPRPSSRSPPVARPRPDAAPRSVVAALPGRPLLRRPARTSSSAGSSSSTLGAGRLLLRWDHGEHPDAVDVVLGLDAELVADRRPAGQDRAVEDAPRLAGAGGAPRPRPVGGRARELDLDAGGHGGSRYRWVAVAPTNGAAYRRGHGRSTPSATRCRRSTRRPTSTRTPW